MFSFELFKIILGFVVGVIVLYIGLYHLVKTFKNEELMSTKTFYFVRETVPYFLTVIYSFQIFKYQFELLINLLTK